MKRAERMLKFLGKMRRPLTFLPAVCMICFIFGFSAQTGEKSSSLSMQVTETVVRAADRLTGAGWTEEEIEKKTAGWNIYIRKAAHMSEYAVLAVLLFLPLHGCNLRGKRLIVITLLICAVLASGDEWHQSFVSGRSPSVRDVGIDCAGCVMGTAAAWILWRGREQK